MRVARLWVHFIPPSQAHEAASGDVFEVVEVGCKEEDGDDEDEDTGRRLDMQLSGRRDTAYKFPIKRIPNRYTRRDAAKYH